MKYWTVIKGGALDRVVGAATEDEVADGLLAGESLVEGYYPADQFHIDAQGQIALRRDMQLSLSVALEGGCITLNEGETLTIGNLPANAKVSATSLTIERRDAMALITGMTDSGYDCVTVQTPGFKEIAYPVRQRLLAAVVSQQCATVDAERERRAGQPIMYQGRPFDAGATSLASIRGWQAHISAGSPVPAGFVWRDANNAEHPAGAAFINGLSAAISARDFELRKAAWAHKQAIRSLATVRDVDAYDMSHNWPAEPA